MKILKKLFQMKIPLIHRPWFWVLLAVAALSVLSHNLFSEKLNILYREFYLLNVSGKQRMRIFKAVVMVDQFRNMGPNELRNWNSEFKTNLNHLKDNHKLIKNLKVKIFQNEEMVLFDKKFSGFIETLERIESSQEELSAHLVYLLESQSQNLVDWQNKLVNELENVGTKQVENLVTTNQYIFAMQLLLLFLSGLFIFKRMDERLMAEEKALKGSNAELSQKTLILEDTIEELNQLSKVESDRTQAILSITEDLEIKQTELEEKIKQQNREKVLSRSAVESAPNGMIMIDESGQIILANSQIEEIFNYSKEEIIGNKIEILIPEQFRSDHPEKRDRFFKAPMTRRMGLGMDLEGVKSDGTEFPVEVGLNPFETDEGKFVIASIVDISERREIEDKLNSSNIELENTNAELQEILYIVSHDLKSPLVTIQGFTGILLSNLDDKTKCLDSIDRIQNAVKRMTELIDDILTVSRVGDISDNLELVDFNEVLDGIKNSLDSLLNEKSIKLEINHINERLNFLHSPVCQVFENLITNAIKYGCRVPEPKITIGSEVNSEALKVYVKDEGPGIPKQYQNKIFQLFQRIDTDNEDGTGLGLAIVSKIMTSIGGRVWVESEEGKGATFWLEFPIDHVLTTQLQAEEILN